MSSRTVSYLVCATPRSGSTLLCEALRRTGVAGAPDEYFQALAETGLPRRPLEYFEGVDDPEIRAILGGYSRVDEEISQVAMSGADSYATYLALVRKRATTPNGVFGAKVMWGYLAGMLAHLRQVPEYADGSIHAVLHRAFPELRYVHVTRNDKVRQAVSLWRAIQTWTWRHPDGPTSTPRGQLVYSLPALRHLERQLEEHDRAWRHFFAGAGIDPLTIVFERFAEDYEGTVTAVLDHLGVERPPGFAIEPPAMRRQADELSELWAEWYLAGHSAHDDRGIAARA